MRLLFIGERPSIRARLLRVGWRDGALAGKQLFDALEACGLSPTRHSFNNLFQMDRDVVSRTRLREVRRSLRGGLRPVAMGDKVSRALSKLGIAHLKIVHPAARGRIRKKARYARHVRRQLSGVM